MIEITRAEVLKRLGYEAPSLVYTESGEEVKVGDGVTLNGETHMVTYFCHPHKPSASGRVTVQALNGQCYEYYVTVIGAKWVNRRDQPSMLEQWLSEP